MLAELGFVIPQGISHISKCGPEIIENAENDLPGNFRLLIGRLTEYLKALNVQVTELEGEIVRWHKENEASKRLAEIPGVGPLTASAIVASVGDARNFKNARQLDAWLGLVPRQHSSGGKPTLLGISKRGFCGTDQQERQNRMGAAHPRSLATRRLTQPCSQAG